MNVDRNIVVAAGLVVTAVLWIAALALRRVHARVVIVGLRNGLIIALVLGTVVAGLTVILLSAQPGVADVGQIAISVGLTVAAGFLWLGATIMPIGFIARGGRDWARVGTWVAVVVLISSFGLGWTAYNSFQERSANSNVPSATPTAT